MAALLSASVPTHVMSRVDISVLPTMLLKESFTAVACTWGAAAGHAVGCRRPDMQAAAVTVL